MNHTSNIILPRYNWNIVESVIKHDRLQPQILWSDSEIGKQRSKNTVNILLWNDCYQWS